MQKINAEIVQKTLQVRAWRNRRISLGKCSWRAWDLWHKASASQAPHIFPGKRGQKSVSIITPEVMLQPRNRSLPRSHIADVFCFACRGIETSFLPFPRWACNRRVEGEKRGGSSHGRRNPLNLQVSLVLQRGNSFTPGRSAAFRVALQITPHRSFRV